MNGSRTHKGQSFKATIKEWGRFSRFHEWHPGKMPLLLTCLFMHWLLHHDPVSIAFLIRWYVAFCCFLGFAYMLNNISDLEVDLRGGKCMPLAKVCITRKWIVTILVGTTGFLAAAVQMQPIVIAAMAFCYVLAIIYSLPPRLKETVIGGPLVAAIGQLVAPAGVLLCGRQWPFPVEVFYLVILFLYGLRMILVHQILDCDRDRATGTHTAVTELGKDGARMILRFVFVVELLFFVGMLALLMPRPLPFASILVFLLPMVLVVSRRAQHLPLALDNHRYIPLADIYETFMPMLMATALAFRDGKACWILPIAVILLFLKRNGDRISNYYYTLRHDLYEEPPVDAKAKPVSE